MSSESQQSVILVVDDDETIRCLVRRFLQCEGFFVLSASDGQEAMKVSRLCPGRIDLLITDIDMPKLNGTQLCEMLRQERPGTKVILMTGSDAKSLTHPVLTKPFQPETLTAKVTEVLARQSRPTAL